jgi:signal peptidase I
MYNVKTIESAVLFPFINEFFQNQQNVRITVTGNSMRPFLREELDSVELSSSAFSDLYFGQIVLIKRKTGEYILHRIVFKKKNCFYISGDAQIWIEGPLFPEQLVAGVTKIWRKNKPLLPDNLPLKLLYCFWWLRLPIKLIITRLHIVIKKIIPGFLKR